MQKLRQALVGLVGILICVALLAGCGRSEGNSQPSKPYATSCMLLNVASAGCDMYKSARGSYPNSLEDLASVRDDAPRKDAWGHDFGFTPFDGSKGYGEVISYGRDGKPGGAGEDADITIRFPVKANADWNRSQASSIKVPPQIPKDWYEFYLR